MVVNVAGVVITLHVHIAVGQSCVRSIMPSERSVYPPAAVVRMEWRSDGSGGSCSAGGTDPPVRCVVVWVTLVC